MAATIERSRGAGAVAAARPVAVAATAGFVAGALVGGIGGRLAMLVLRLTSDPALHGLDTDDGFTIGIVSGETTFLVAFTAFLGVLGGLAYLLARTWLPARARIPVAGALAALVGGAQVLRPHGIDFTLLEPLWLAIAMFVVLPGAFGVLVSRLVERWLRDPGAFDRPPSIVAGALLPLIPFVLLGPRGLALVAVVLLAIVLRMRPAGIGGIVTSRPAAWIARLALAGIGVAAGVVLVSDIAEIL